MNRPIVQLLALLAILLLALGLRVEHYTGPIGSDDHDYYLAAYDVYEGTYEPTENYWKNRFGMILPIAASYAVLGANEYAAAAWPMLASLGAIVLCFLLGKALMSAQTGLLAALLLAFYPLDIHYSGLILPDIPISFLIAASVFAFLKAFGSGERYSLFLFFLSGLLLAIAYSCRSMSIIVLPFFALYIVFFERKLKPAYLLFVAGLLTVVALEGVYYHLNGLSPLHNILLNAEAAVQVNSANECSTSQLYYPQVIFKNLNVFGAYFFLFIPAMVAALFKRGRGALAPLVWAAVLLLILQFGIVSLDPVIHIVKVRKFLNYATVPLILLGASALMQLRQWIRWVVILLLICASVYLLRPYRYPANMTPEASGSQIRYVAKYLQQAPPKPIYADPRTQAMLMLLSKFSLEPERFRNLYKVESANDLSDCYVVINGFYIRFDPATTWAGVPQFVAQYPKSIPAHWIPKDFFASAVYIVP